MSEPRHFFVLKGDTVSGPWHEVDSCMAKDHVTAVTRHATPEQGWWLVLSTHDGTYKRLEISHRTEIDVSIKNG